MRRGNIEFIGFSTSGYWGWLFYWEENSNGAYFLVETAGDTPCLIPVARE